MRLDPIKELVLAWRQTFKSIHKLKSMQAEVKAAVVSRQTFTELKTNRDLQVSSRHPTTVRTHRTSTTQWKSGQFSSLWFTHFSEISIHQRRMWDVLQRIMHPPCSSSCKSDWQLHPWLFEEGLRLSELVETSLLEWPHLWKRSPRTQEMISYLLSRLQSCWFHSHRDERSHANPWSGKESTTQPTNPPPKLPIHNLVLPDKGGDNQVLLYLCRK